MPFLDFDNARFPIHGGLLQRRGGTARHDAVVWGYARGADMRGVDIIENCEVTGIDIARRPRHGARHDARHDPGEKDRPRGRRQHLARRRDGGPAAADRKPRAAGLRVGRHQAGDRPVVTFGAGHFYISQSDKGGLVFGGDIDGYNSYAWRGNLPIVEDVMEDGMATLAGPRPHPHAAPVGRADGHVDGRLADHRPDAGRRALSQLRLVLRRLQGDARVRLVLRAPDRARRAASRSPPRCGSIATRPAR